MIQLCNTPQSLCNIFIVLQKIAEWFRTYKLTLIAPKTKYILFSKKRQSVNFDSPKLFKDDKAIDRIGTGYQNESFKFVGINLNEYLT